jgi:hypothetical protein
LSFRAFLLVIPQPSGGVCFLLATQDTTPLPKPLYTQISQFRADFSL